MDAVLYAKILSDKSLLDLKKIHYKYPDANMDELITLFKTSVYKVLPIPAFSGDELVYMEQLTQIGLNAVKLLLKPQSSREGFGIKAMEDEIAATFAIESIDFNRDSVRHILQGRAPADEQEHRIYGMKKGLEFIADLTNTITEENIFKLYDMAVGQFLDGDARLKPNAFYRHDAVYVVGQDIEHVGLSHKKVPKYMQALVAFAQEKSTMNELVKAAAIHFCIAYIHPYFDGNGRMARLLHMWYLCQQGYSSALFIPLSSFIERSRKKYYDAYTLAEDNAKISGVMDITPFLVYFIENVYDKLGNNAMQANTPDAFNNALADGLITEKEKDLWNFALSAYGDGEFSTKQLERDFGNAAYATIRGFVLKFEGLALLSAQKYGNRIKYSIMK